MSYELDSGGATRLLVEQDKTMDGVTPLVLIQAEHLMGDTVAVTVKPDDAPALALAILEAAGLAPYEVGCTADRYFAHEAVNKLRDAVQFRKDQAERDAEDAKAKAYRYAIFPAAVLWEHLDEDAREAHRVKYRTARDYFAQEG